MIKIIDNEEYKPFPVELLPEPLRGYVEAAAISINCDPVYLVLPLLSCLGSAIGNSTTIKPKNDWLVPSVFWTASVGESGTGKSPAFRTVTAFISELESKACRAFNQNVDEYETTLAAWKKEGKDSKKPKPEPPIQQRYYVDDTTTEALQPVLAENPRGVMVINGELKAWFSSFDRYVTSKGSDAAKWLQIWDGTALSVDRKTGGKRNIRVDAPLVNVTGTIQPAVLQKSVKNVHEENGLLARILIAYPPSKPATWNDDCLDEKVQVQVSKLFSDLFKLTGNEDGTPKVIGLSSEAMKVWANFFNDNQSLVSTTQGFEKYAFAKHDQYVLRLALLIHVVKALGSGAKIPQLATRETFQESVALIRWFQDETCRAYALMNGAQDRDVADVVMKIAKNKGQMTVRELMKSNGRKYNAKPKAVDALNRLKEAGFGDWIGSNTFAFDPYGMVDRVEDADYDSEQLY
ncbi:YfjI family protein [Mariniblastus sp.]|nr:YfjI family protein [Mariniblastus sp.]